MALFNVIQAANYIYSNKNRRGTVDVLHIPKCIDWIFPFGGRSGIGAIPNGFGKSGVVDGSYAILSKNKALFRSAKARMAPMTNTPSHIRIEFLLPRHNTNQFQLSDEMLERNSDKHVVGMVGHRDPSAKVIFYSYRGRLEDVPIYHADTKEFLGMDDYLELLERVGAHTSTNLESPEDWHEKVIKGELKISSDIVDQLVEYQRLGGDDKAASLFQLKRMKDVKSPQAAFFYQTIVPEIFRNVVRATGTPEGKQEFSNFRDGLDRFGSDHREMVSATLQAQKNLEELKNDATHIQKIVQKACRKEGLQNMAEEVVQNAINDLCGAYEAICAGGIVPGMPTWKSSGIPDVDVLTRHMVYAHDEGLMLSLRGLEKLLNCTSSDLTNSAQIRNPVMQVTKISELSDFIHLSTNFKNVLPKEYQKRGSFVAFEDVVHVFSNSHITSTILHDRDQAEVAELISKAFEFAELHILNDPARQHLQKVLDAHSQWETAYTQHLYARLRDLNEAKKTIEDDIDAISNSPAKQEHTQNAIRLQQNHEKKMDITKEGVLAYDSTVKQLSRFGKTPSAIQTSINDINHRFDCRVSRIDNWLTQKKPAFTALSACSQNAETVGLSLAEYVQSKIRDIDDLIQDKVQLERQELASIQRRIEAVERGEFFVPEDVQSVLDEVEGVTFEPLAQWVNNHLDKQDIKSRCFTLMSGFLHCPVCPDLKSAKAMAKQVSQSGVMKLPVFWKEGILNAVDNSTEEMNGEIIVSSPFLGIETAQVKALVDPDRLELDRQELLQKKSVVNDKIDKLNSAIEQAQSIGGHDLRELLNKTHIYTQFTKVDKIKAQISEQKGSFDEQIGPFLSDLQRAIFHERDIQEKNTSQDLMRDIFERIDALEERQKQLNALLKEERREQSEHLGPLNHRLSVLSKKKRALQTFIEKKLPQRIALQGAKIFEANALYAKYFSALCNIQGEYISLKKKAKSKGIELEPMPGELASEVKDLLAQKDIIRQVKDFDVTCAIALITEVLSKCTHAFERSTICRAKRKGREGVIKAHPRGDNLFSVYSKLNDEIDSLAIKIDSDISDLHHLVSGKLPQETVGKICHAVEIDQFGKLNTELKVLKATLAKKERESKKSEQFESDSRKELIEHLVYFAGEGVKNLRHFQAVCNASDDYTLVVKGSAIRGESQIREVVTAVVQSFEDQAKNPEDAPTIDDLYIDFLKGIFREPTVEIKHSAIHPAGREFSLESKVSTGEGTAIGLLILTKLKEYARARAGKLNEKEQGDFVIIDGIFSNCSRSNLWEGSLNALSSSTGSFQLIGFLHDISFVNNFEIFPRVFYGKPQQGNEHAQNSQDCWATIHHVASKNDILFARGSLVEHPEVAGIE